MGINNENNTLIESVYSLTPLQEGIIYHHITDTKSTGYVIQDILELIGEIDEKKIVQAIKLLIMKNDVLRTTFRYQKQLNPKQIILIDNEAEYEKIDLSGLSKSDKNKRIECIAKLDVERRFDLENDSLIRVKLIILDNNHYKMIWSFHHIIIDNWSLPLIYDDFYRYYGWLKSGKKISEVKSIVLEEKNNIADYREYVEWLNEQDKKSGLEYWKELLLDYDENAEIKPIIKPDSTEVHIVKEEIKLSKEISQKLYDITEAMSIKISTVVEAAWGIVLQRYNYTNDVVFGKVFSGRNANIKGIENMVGLFVNTIPERVKCSEEMTFLELLKELNSQDAINRNYAYCSLAEIQGLTKQKNGLIKTILVFEDYDKKIKENECGVNIKIESERRETNFAITLNLSVEDGILSFKIIYNANNYTNDEIKSVLKRIESILHAFAANPEGKISEIQEITEDEKVQILNEFNNTFMEYPKHKTIQQLFEEQVERTPDNIALMCGDKQITYSQLNSMSNSLARVLCDKGVKSDTIVGIMAERSLEMIIGIYAILKAGGAYMPISPEYPQERIDFMLSDSNTKILLIQKKFKDKAGYGVEVLEMEERGLYEGNTSNLHINIPKSLAYIIYTSGSTGKPKGVMIQHYSLINRINWMQRLYHINENDVIMQKTPYTFDVSVWELFWWSWYGARLCMLTPGGEKDPALICNAIEKYNITTMHFVPSMLTSFLEHIEYGNNINNISSLKQIFASGEALNIKQVEKFNKYIFEIYGAKLHNLYGPTEAAIDVSYFNCSTGEKLEIVPIGKPIDNINLYIADSKNNLKPIGAPGELCIAGDGLARGYLNRPELTAEKFVENPFIPGKKMYHTGDLARWLPDGNIEYLGRIDEQVKIRGLRIELGEIESSISNIESVRNAAVLAREDASGDKAIFAYFVADKELKVLEIKDILRQSLPEYMIPAYMMQIDSIPVTGNGKLDKKALPQIETKSKDEYIAPRNKIEETLCNIFSEILCVGRVGIKDSFFELGGDSIKAIRVVSKMRSNGYKVSVKEIMDRYTVEAISYYVVALSDENIYEQEDVIGKITTTPIISQFREWNFEKPNHFNQDAMIEIDTDDEMQLKKVLDALGKHHDALRSVYRKGSLEILSSSESKLYDFKVFDLKNEEDWSNKIQEVCTGLQSSIDLKNGPLMKAALLKMRDRNYLFICIHHLVVDGVSWRIILEDFNTAMNQVREGKEIVLPAKTASFKEWSEALEEYKGSKQLQNEKKYWKKVADKMKDSKISVNEIKAGIGNGDVIITFSKEETENLLQKAGKAFNTKINDLLLSAIGMAVKKLTGQMRISVCMEGHGREEIHKKIDIDRTVGWFTSMYPIVIQCSDDIKESIISTKEMLRKLPNHGLGYGLMKEEFQENESDIYFNYLGEMDSESKAIFNSTGKRSADENKNFASIAFSGIVSEGKLIFTIKYDKSRFDTEKIENLAELYKESLIKIIIYCIDQKEAVRTASDYSTSDLTNEDLSIITNRFRKPLEIVDIYSLTSLQEGILYHNLSESQSTEYIIQDIIELVGDINENKIKHALKLLLTRHEVLKTAIVYEKLESPRQVIIKNREVEYQRIDLSGLSEKEQNDRITEIAVLDVERGFDLQNDSLIRVKNISLDNNKCKMIWSYHHIIIDGWCLALMYGDFKKYYNFLTSGKSMAEIEQIVLEEKCQTAEYGEYIKWLEGQDKENGLSYWRELLSDYDEMSEIKPMIKPEESEAKVANAKIRISREVSQSLIELAAHNNFTINTVAEAALGIVLQRYSFTSDVVFGKVVSGRNVDIRGIEKIVGLFIKTVPTRVTSNDDTIVLDLLKELQKQGTESDYYSYCSLAEIQELTRQKSGLIKALLVFENHLNQEEGNNSREGLQLKFEYVREQTNYPISIIAGVEDGILRFEIMYNPNEYIKEEIQRILKRIESVLYEFVAKPQGKVSEIQAVSEEEKVKVLREFNNTYADYPRYKTIAELFEEQVKKTPLNTAVTFKGQKISYAELNNKANQLAEKLINLGVKPDDFVGIMADKSIEMIVGICGIVKAGGAYVPIDSAYPKERIKFMLEDCKPKVVVIYGAEIETEIPIIDLKDNSVWEGTAQNPQKVNSSNDLLYCIYTSGTTGNPKGVLVEHKAAVRLVKNTNYVKLDETTVILQTGSMVFDAATFEIWGILLNGGKLILADNDIITSSRRMKEYIQEYKVNTLFLTTALYNQMIKSDSEMFDSLKYFFVGGEKLSEKHVRMLKDRNNCVKFANIYGPTENTTFSTFCEVPNGFEMLPIGKPISNTKAYIINNDRLCGIGIPGELCIAGDGLARGYLNRPEITAEKFVENPFIPGERIYHSGDLVRWLPDGNIEYLGRIDEQVKIRGFRIELDEIESVLMKIENIKNTAVIAREDDFGDKAVCAYFVSDRKLSISEIRDKLSKSLPEYMIPSYMMQIDSIPLNKNGKIDKRALPKIETKIESEYIAPRNEIEETLCNVFSEVLGIEKVGVKDNFFELGGHSLKATKLVNQIEAKNEYRITLNDVFTNPTPEKLALLITRKDTEKYVSIPIAEDKEYYPMSSTQKRTYLVCQMDIGGITYNIPQCIRIKGKVRLKDMKYILQKIIERHEILRTSFLLVDGEPVQKILDTAPEAEFEYIEDVETPETELMKRFIRPFDLAKPPLVRLRVVKREDCYLLMLDMHHIVGDGMSMGTFIKEFTELYNGETLKPIKNQYKDYSEWIRKRDLSDQKEYWVNEFCDEIPILDMPLDYTRPQIQSHKGAIVDYVIDKELAEKIKKIAYGNGATEYMIFLSAAMILLDKYSRREDIVIGSLISGRTHKDTESMLGMFVNTLAMRGKPEGKKSYDEFLQEVKQKCLKAYDNQEYPFEELVEAVEVRRDMSRNPLFDVLVVMQNNEQTELNFNGAESEYVKQESSISKFDLNFNICEENKSYQIALEYCTELFKVESANRILAHYVAILEQITMNSKIKISEVEAIAKSEKSLILEEFNNTYDEYARESTVMDLFENQVKKKPDYTAITFGNEQLTYSELNMKVNQLARRLRELGIKPDDFVAIIAERNIEMIVAIFGILKAGGAYVPIDPTYPKDRIQYIIEDCQPKVILTTGVEIDFQVEIPIINLFDKNIFTGTSTNLVKVTAPNDLAYCIYTSGTTGRPKGVMIENHSLMSNMCYSAKRFLSKEILVPLFTNYCFDLTVPSIFLPLCYGGTIDLISKEKELDIDYILKNKEYTFIKMTPSQLKTLVGVNKSICLRKLHCLVVGGEPLESLVANWILETYGKHIKLINEYGPTEATVGSTTYIYSNTDANIVVPIGKPVANTQIYIMNGMNLCGIGVVGEICIGGEQIARGYINKPELTTQKFIDNPFGEGKLYRTGDLARWMPDGNIECIGRSDEQVKIRGFRIELSEIYHAIKSIENIKDAAVIVREDKNGYKAINAYFVSDKEINFDNVRDELRRKIPEYMVPAYMMQIEKIPVTGNGKIDKNALPNIEVRSKREYNAPRNLIEEILCSIFSETLGVKRVSVKDSFFELGGDSIKAIRIVSRMRNSGYEISVKDIMSKYTVEAIAHTAILSNENNYAQNEVVGKVISTPIIRNFEISKLAKPSHYNQDVMIEIDLDDGIGIKRVLDALVVHHDIIRSVYRDGSLEILNSKESKLYDFQVFDLKNEDNVSQIIQDKCTKLQGSIDLENGPLMKAALFKVEKKNYLFICLHHLVVDNVSWHILIEDFETAINQVKSGKQIILPNKTASFKEWAEALEEYRISKQLNKELKYWEKVSDDMKDGRIAIDNNGKETGYADVVVTFDEKETENLIYKTRKAFNTEINDLLLSAVGMSVKMLTGQTKVSLGLEGHGREEIHKKVDIDRTVGWFTIKYPIVIKCSDDIQESIVSTKEMLRKIPNHGLGYGLLYNNFQEIESDIFFNYLGQIDTESKNSNATFYSTGENIAYENGISGNIDINGYIKQGKLEFLIRYNKNMISCEIIESFIKLYKKCLIDISRYCMRQEKTLRTASDYSASDLTSNELSILNNRFGETTVIDDIYSLTYLQEGMLYHNVADSKSTGYVTQVVYSLRDKVDEEKIKQALKLIVMRHDVLRTAIVYDELRIPRQVVLQNREVEYEKLDLSKFNTTEQEEKIVELTENDIKRGFDLQNDSLLRIKYIVLNDCSHRIIWSYHHIIFDGWCSSMVFRDFALYYNGLKNGRIMEQMEQLTFEEKNETATYGEYVRWLENQNKELGLAYWQELLDDYDEIAEIKPMIKPNPTKKQMERIGISISDEVREKLLKIAALNNITISTVAEAALGIVLQKYNYSNDVVFGKVVSGRNADIRGITNVVGLFINTIPTRIRCSSDISVIEFLKDIQKQGMESNNYFYCSLSEIQGITRQKSELIKVLYVFENYYVNQEKLKDAKDGLKFELESAREQTNYAITVSAEFSGKSLDIDILYNPNEYIEEEIQRILKRIESVLYEFVAKSQGKVSEIQAISEEEKVKVLSEFNNTYTEYPRDKSIVDLFEEQVRKTPENIAVLFKGQGVTYAELSRKANQLAEKLRNLGVKPDDFVAIMAERSIEMIVGICGIIKAGSAYVPIDSSYPKDRIKFMLEDCKPKAVIIYNTEIETEIPVIDITERNVFEEDFEELENVNKSKDLAYCIYTSGTTGKPKGSLIEHKSIIRLVKNTNYIELNEKSIILQTGSISFDAATLEIWGTLLNGGKLILVDSEAITNNRKLKQYIKKYEVNTMWLTSSLYNQMIQMDSEMFDNLKYLLIGGEKLSKEHVKILKDRNTSVKLINGYGPTENATFTTTYEIPGQFEIIPIGKPIANTRTYIMNRDKLCGIGIPGELCIAGDGLTRGYLNRPELTAEKLVENPFIFGEKMYRSGDMARWLHDGNIEYLGRIDEQIKIRGFRIELSEIESVLMKIESIKDAVVIAREDDFSDKAICAYFVSDRKLSISEIRDKLSKSLPEYMVPSYMMQIDSIPLNKNGKIDKRALPKIETKIESKYIAPRNEIEETLCNVFSEVLGIEKVGIRDSFFELGGDSIKAIRVVSKMRSEGYEVTVKEIMTKYKVETIASSVVTSSNKKGYQQNEVTGKVIATPIICQFEAWKLKKPNHFNQDIIMEVNVDNEIQIRKVLRALAIHHDIIRSVYRNGSLEILSSEESKLYELRVFNLKDMYAVDERIEDECTRLQSSIDLENGPLMKAALFKTRKGNNLFICIHHLVVDSVSWNILIEDFNAAMKQVKEDNEIALPPKTASFKEWAEALDEYRSSTQIKKEQNYWKKVIDNMKDARITLNNISTETGYADAMITFTKEETENLVHKANKAFNTEINDLFLSAIGMAVKELTGQAKISIFMEGHGREEIHKKIDIDRTVGWFTSIYPVVVECSDDMQESIVNAKEMLRKIPNHGLGYGLVENKLEEVPVDLYFNYLGQIDVGFKESNAIFYSTGKSFADENNMFRNININGSISNGVLIFTFMYDRSRFSADFIAQFTKLYKTCLNQIIKYCISMDETVRTISDSLASDLNLEDLSLINNLFDE